MAEQVQIDLVVNTTQLDVAEARYDALKARQLGLQGGTVAPGLGVPGALAGGAVLTQMANASTMSRILAVAQRRRALQVAGGPSLIGPEAAAVLGFTEQMLGPGSGGEKFVRYEGGFIGVEYPNHPMIKSGNAFGMNMFSPESQNMYGKEYLTRQYYLQTGRMPESTLSAQEIYKQTVMFEEQKRTAAKIVAEAATTNPALTAGATAAASNSMWSKAKKVVGLGAGGSMSKLWSKFKNSSRISKITKGGGVLIALAALNNYTDDIIEDGEFREAAGISPGEGENIADRSLGKSVIQFARDIDASLISPFAKLYVKAAAPFASYATTNNRIQRIEENLRAIRSGGYGVLFSNKQKGAALRAEATVKQARSDMIKQNEWGTGFQEGLNELDRRADSIAQDFAQRFYGGGDVGRGDVADWVKQGAVQYQKGKFAEEAWKQHPNARIAKDPPKE